MRRSLSQDGEQVTVEEVEVEEELSSGMLDEEIKVSDGSSFSFYREERAPEFSPSGKCKALSISKKLLGDTKYHAKVLNKEVQQEQKINNSYSSSPEPPPPGQRNASQKILWRNTDSAKGVSDTGRNLSQSLSLESLSLGKREGIFQKKYSCNNK